MAAIVAIPGPVVAAYFIVLVASLLILGIRVLMHDGLDHRKGFAVGIAFWLGIAFQLEWIFPELLQGRWSALLGNSMTVGGLTVIALTQFVELTGPRPRRLKTELTPANLTKIDSFLSDFAARGRRSGEMTDRLRAVGEEMLLHSDAAGRGRQGARGTAPAAGGAQRRRGGRTRVCGDDRRQPTWRTSWRC